MKNKIGLWFFLFFFLSSQLVVAIGVSPPRVVLESLHKGVTLEQSVVLSGINDGQDVTVTLQGDGSDWIELPMGEEFVFSGDQLEYPFVFNIPTEAPNGDYVVTAQIIATNDEAEQGANTASLSAGVLVELIFSISGEEVIDYRITNVAIPDIEIGSSLLVILTVDNDGNVLAKPEKAELRVKDVTRSETLYTEEITDLSSVEPYGTGKSIAKFSIDLEEGQYFADIYVHTPLGIKETKDIPLNILPRGQLASSGDFIDFVVDGDVSTIAKLQATFENTGDIDLQTILKGEVYKDGALIDTFSTELTHVGLKEKKDILHYYTISEEGEYEVKAWIEFLGKKTETKELSFVTGGSSGSAATTLSGDSNLTMVIGIVGAAIVLLLAILIIVVVKKK